MTQTDETRIPALARGCRMSPDRQLLMPEGLLKLSASGARIVELCDGRRTVAEIIALLQAEHDAEARDRIRLDVTEYLAKLAAKKAVELR